MKKKLDVADYEETDLDDDPELKELLDNTKLKMGGVSPFAKWVWDDVIDMRVAAPQALDLKKLWSLTNSPIPNEIEARLGPKTPILISNMLTPFAPDGRDPVNIWAMGYEVDIASTKARTVSVAPKDEVYHLGEINSTLGVNIGLDGGVSCGGGVDIESEDGPSISLNDARVQVATNQSFQFTLKMPLTLRKVVGAPSGNAGAVWKMYRQDERLDRTQNLFQTLLIDAAESTELSCVVKTWVKQAGWLGTRWGARRWKFEDQVFSIDLQGLPVQG